MSRYENPQTEAFRVTLDRLPDEIALAIGLHIYDSDTLGNATTCVCGWAVREAVAGKIGIDSSVAPTPESMWHTVAECERRFGGTNDEWDGLMMGVIEPDEAPLIEEALFDRVMAAATATTEKRPSRRSSRSPKAAKSQKSEAK